MACTCIHEVNLRLAEKHTRLVPTIVAGRSNYLAVSINTELTERKRGAKPARMLATFCPFCGTRYEPKPAGA